MGKTIDAEHLSELTEEEYEVNFMKSNLKGFVKLDVKYLIPFFTRRFTHQAFAVSTSMMEVVALETMCGTKLANKLFICAMRDNLEEFNFLELEKFGVISVPFLVRGSFKKGS
ncbi:hypothetical protein CDAR_93191 [Caerostris darwini]|uniref:Uncharacterized protein n=1 Tax=Caerostris darwini TaxID=1538125 RepID=A0AAV4X1P7_9ARAC|nr:hypothetical protein CDAR_93191 [Caerostris darwini]